MTSGIYLIKNTINGKIYIGSSLNIDKRWSEHLRLLRQNKHINKKLQHSWNKYSECNFIFDILEYTDINLLNREQFYLDEILEANLDSDKFEKLGLNILKIAGRFDILSGDKNPFYGKKHTEESKTKMSKKKLGINNPHYGVGVMLGRKHSNDSKTKMSLANSGSNNINSKKVYQYTKDNILIKKWNSAGEVARILNISQGNISSCCLGKQKTAYGYIWSYQDLYITIC